MEPRKLGIQSLLRVELAHMANQDGNRYVTEGPKLLAFRGLKAQKIRGNNMSSQGGAGMDQSELRQASTRPAGGNAASDAIGAFSSVRESVHSVLPKCVMPIGRYHCSPLAALVVWLLPCVLFSLMVAWVWSFRVDDAYITLRYAQNFISGHGLVFNIGERFEAYTNFSLVLIESVFIRLGLDPLTSVAILTGSCGLGLILGVQLFAWKRHRSNLSVLVAGMLVATATPLILWTPAGLETTLYALLVTVCVVLQGYSMAGGKNGAGMALAKAMLLFLATLTRPDAIVFVGMAILLELFRSARTGSYYPALAFIASIVLFFCCYGFWKLSYYGAVLPGPFYAKTATNDFLWRVCGGWGE